MKNKFNLIIKLLLVAFFFLFPYFNLTSPVLAEEKPVCVVYFHGIGCSHCAKTDPIVLKQLLEKHSRLTVIGYEIYQHKENAAVFNQYNDFYHSGLGIPLVIFNQQTNLVGDRQINQQMDDLINQSQTNLCPLVDGRQIEANRLAEVSLPGKPEIFTQEKLKSKLKASPLPVVNSIKPKQSSMKKEPISCFHFSKIFSLALVDAVNPCALAVLILMLVAIMTYNPQKRKNILEAGLAFSLSVLVVYFLYGIAIVKFFKVIKAISVIKLSLYRILGIGAIGLGLLNLKDFFHYKPGGLLTEMPLSLRPKAKKLLKAATEPKGALIVGALVTVFLLPCTVGPYIICGGILSTLSWAPVLGWLFIYDLIFILPMIIITVICYLGLTKIKKVSGWKEKNIRYLHLISGLIILILGLVMILGWE